MGWTFQHKPQGVKAVDAIRQSFGDAWWQKHIIAHTATREAVFLVWRGPAKDAEYYVPDADGMIRALLVIAIKSAKGDYNFGHKGMQESMGPYGCEAPLSILKQCSALRDPIGPLREYDSLQSIRDYRARCRKAAERKAAKRGLKPGAKVEFKIPLTFRNGMSETRFTVEKRKRAVYFRAEGGGFLCRITAAQLAQATIA